MAVFKCPNKLYTYIGQKLSVYMKKACSTLKKLKAKSSKNLINVNKELRTKKPNEVQDRGYKKIWSENERTFCKTYVQNCSIHVYIMYINIYTYMYICIIYIYIYILYTYTYPEEIYVYIYTYIHVYIFIYISIIYVIILYHCVFIYSSFYLPTRF